MFPKQMLNSKEWKELPSAEKLVYLHLKAKYAPKYNGRIKLYHSELKDVVGLKNSGSRCKAFKGLEDKGWIKRTKLGGLYRYFNEYELTGKYDPSINWLKVFYEKPYK